MVWYKRFVSILLGYHGSPGNVKLANMFAKLA